MTKGEAVAALERIEKVLRDLEAHDERVPLDKTTFKQRAHRERMKVDDIIGVIKKLERGE